MKIVESLKKFPKFLREVKEELKKVSWSKREELFGATWVVIATTFLLAAYIGSIDFGLSKFFNGFFKMISEFETNFKRGLQK